MPRKIGLYNFLVDGSKVNISKSRLICDLNSVFVFNVILAIFTTHNYFILSYSIDFSQKISHMNLKK